MAEEALRYLLEHEAEMINIPQIIFLDIHMPAMNGFEFLEAFDKLSETLKNKVRIYVISSTFDEKDIERIKKDRNVCGFYEKPLSKEVLTKLSNYG